MALVPAEKSDRSLHLSKGQAAILVRRCYSAEPSRPSAQERLQARCGYRVQKTSRLQLRLNIQTLTPGQNGVAHAPLYSICPSPPLRPAPLQSSPKLRVTVVKLPSLTPDQQGLAISPLQRQKPGNPASIPQLTPLATSQQTEASCQHGGA